MWIDQAENTTTKPQKMGFPAATPNTPSATATVSMQVAPSRSCLGVCARPFRSLCMGSIYDQAHGQERDRTCRPNAAKSDVVTMFLGAAFPLLARGWVMVPAGR